METDLPVIPCYDSNNCGIQYNCGPTFCDSQNADPPSVNPSDILKCNQGEVMGSCYGNNPNYCNGIQSCCDNNIPPDQLTCNVLDINKPVIGTGLNKHLGCTINNDGTSNVDCVNQGKASCMEYVRDQDKVELNSNNFTNICSEPCWMFGGYEYMKNQCEIKIGFDENMCKAMEYYCDWDNKKNICTLNRQSDKLPWEQFPHYQGTVAFAVNNNCSINECIEIPNLKDEDNNRYSVHSAQSAWDSKKQTTYDPTTRIVCVTDSKKNKKVCLSAPRCQTVESTKDCGLLELESTNKCNNYFENSLDPPCSNETNSTSNVLFMCSKFITSNIKGELANNTTFNKNGFGYCTWCKNTQYKGNFEPNQDRVNSLINLNKGIIPVTRDPIDWDTNPPNRCENYNECEVPDSEEKWNKCIFDISEGEFGYNYNDLKNKTPEEIRNILTSQGFCANLDCLIKNDCNKEDTEKAQKQNKYIEHCKNELSYMGSINWGRVMSPDNKETAACQYSYTWYNLCNLNTNQSENYLCTWCPSNQCKVGSKDQICSEVSEGRNSWNNLPYCDTNKNYGQMTEKAKELGAPDQCDCFLPKTKDNQIVNNGLETEDIVVLASAGSLIGTLFLSLIFI